MLSQKKVGKYNKKPKIHAQKRDNIYLALKFINETEKIYTVSISESSSYHYVYFLKDEIKISLASVELPILRTLILIGCTVILHFDTSQDNLYRNSEVPL